MRERERGREEGKVVGEKERESYVISVFLPLFFFFVLPLLPRFRLPDCRTDSDFLSFC